ncbi:MAG: hypothetical protein ACNI3A_18765 [Desulfovibrio sp.]|uniref:hypothetical protein n=1 Tax=Desulfovibrio sp. 7SRBS1 TaxID=3378064 RepID=UPI003B3D210A
MAGTRIPQVPEVSDVPQRQTAPPDYSKKMDKCLLDVSAALVGMNVSIGAMNTLAGEVEENAGAIEAAKEAATDSAAQAQTMRDAAAAIVNAKLWEPDEPYTSGAVWRNGRLYFAVSPSTGVAPETDATHTNWLPVPLMPDPAGNDGKIPTAQGAGYVLKDAPAGGGGAEKIEISGDVQLTQSSSRKLAVEPTVDGLVVHLPLASTLGQDGVPYIFFNVGSRAVTIQDADNHTIGGALGTLEPNQARACILLDKTTGLWAIFDYAEGSVGGRIVEAGYIIDPGTLQTFKTATVYRLWAFAVSSNVISVFYQKSYSLYFSRITINSDDTIDVGTQLFIANGLNDNIADVAQCTTTRYCLGWNDEANSNKLSIVFITDNEDDTITVSAATVATTSYINGIKIVPYTDDKAVLLCVSDLGGVFSFYVKQAMYFPENNTSNVGPNLSIKAPFPYDTLLSMDDVCCFFTTGGNFVVWARKSTSEFIQQYRVLDVSDTGSGISYVTDWSDFPVIANFRNPVVKAIGSVFVMCWIDASSLFKLIALQFNSDTNTITAGETVTVDKLTSGVIANMPFDFTPLSQEMFLLSIGTGTSVESLIATLNGLVINSGDTFNILPNRSESVACVPLSDIKCITALNDRAGDNSYYGKLCIQNRR